MLAAERQTGVAVEGSWATVGPNYVLRAHAGVQLLEHNAPEPLEQGEARQTHLLACMLLSCG